jgi:hypothetical protein
MSYCLYDYDLELILEAKICGDHIHEQGTGMMQLHLRTNQFAKSKGK